ncbi:MAG TPA: polyphenol oxidase family protein [Solirubrobacteraceae bacterium]
MGEVELSFDFPGGGHALFTTRTHGNLSSVGGDGAEQGLESREELRAQLGVRRMLRGYQVHGTTVQRVREGRGAGAGTMDSESQPKIEADGQATALSNLGAMVLTADCLPVALGATGAVAMVHAGWRGLAAGVLEEGVRAVRELGGEDDIVAIIGPGAGPCCYEVGEEVHAAFGGAHRAQGPHTGNIDLKAIARDKLLAVGVTKVQDIAMCTICDERFFSYRREGARAGRQGGVAWLS